MSTVADNIRRGLRQAIVYVEGTADQSAYRVHRPHRQAMTASTNHPPTRHDAYPDTEIRRILRETRSIALIGASANPARPSWIVLKYLIDRGYAVTPVNPALAGQELLGRPVLGSLAELSEPVDMVEIFRNSAAAGPLVDEALALAAPPRVIWMQLGVRDDAAAARAEARGLTVIMNRCPKIEYGRLSGEIGWSGVNSRIISARKPKLAKGVQKLTIESRGP